MSRTRRASDAPLFAVCPAAAHPAEGEIVIHRVDEAGNLGTCVHEACAMIVDGQGADTGKLAEKYRLSGDQKRDLIYMVSAFTSWWAQHRDMLGASKTEVEMEHEDLTGHADILSMVGTVDMDIRSRKDDTVYVVDVKTTRLQDVDYGPQLMEYLFLSSKNPHLVETDE